MRRLTLAAMAVCAAPLPGLAADLPAFAQAPAPVMPVPVVPAPFNFYVHVGPAGVLPDEKAKITMAGVRYPTENIRVPNVVTAAVEAGYHITPNWAVSVSGGFPPSFDVLGAGTLKPAGKLGSSVAGPIALTAHYHFLNFGAFQPYIGGGATYMIVFSNKDAFVSRFRLDGAFGAVGQVGADLMITDRIGVFFDIKKAYLRTTATGVVAGLPVKAKVKLDPLVLSSGVTIRF